MPQGADRTAFGPMVIVAADQYEPRPLIVDDVARRILPGPARAAVALSAWRPVRRALVPVDFETQDLAEELAAHGYRSSARTFGLRPDEVGSVRAERR